MSSLLAMSMSERESFLAEAHVGILAVARGDGAAPLATPVWYVYDEGGDVLLNVARDSQKATLLAASPTASLCVQTESLPYRFVTVGGPVTLEPADPGVRRRIAERYLPAEMVDGYLSSSGDVGDMLTVRLSPRTWHSNDFSKLAS